MTIPVPFHAPLAAWGGVESTVNRVHDDYLDQIERSGHARRLDDLDRIAQLGIRTLRYPVVWERVAPRLDAPPDWSWTDERLERLRALGIRPIAGLVHHGSGPRHTNLCASSFADGLEAYAGAVAARYPWIDAYTPVNEPLTTARFSALYGHWYPHAKNNRAWATALLNEVRATVRAMRAIRRVNPHAQLIQTDDLGKTHSTPLLAYQAEFENERRWLTFDLLCGRVQEGHPMWRFLCMTCEVPPDDLAWFAENPCPPDVIGINYYLPSERFLDERLDRYPESSHGGNGYHAYADVMAVRVCGDLELRVDARLREAWERYHLPIAITEAHNGSTREEQMRWLAEIWEGAQTAREAGVDVRAVTVWSLLGVYDWNNLVTRADGFYEPGVFDLRAPTPRPTALAGIVRQIAAGQPPAHPVLAARGWWRRPSRFAHPPVALGRGVADAPEVVALPETLAGAPVLIAGGNGTLGAAIARVCEGRGLTYRRLNRAEMDIADPASVQAALEAHRPWAVINAAGYTQVDRAEHERQVCVRENTQGATVLARACAASGIPLLAFSSDLVFTGERGTPYVETDRAVPLGVYGWSKVEGERQTLAALPTALVVRSGPLFGPWDTRTPVCSALRALSVAGKAAMPDDLVVSPTYIPDLVHNALDLLLDGERGIWHLATPGETTWVAFTRAIAERVGLDPTAVMGRPARTCGFVAPRPPYSALGSMRGTLLPPLENALDRYFHENEIGWQAKANARTRQIA